jgi:hypothetical protein
VVVQVKALACELPATLGAPLSRFSVADVAQQARQFGLVASISDSTVWRWLNADAIRPWQHRCWIFPRDPQFALKAGRILDLYERRWQGQALRADEFVLSTDEKTSIQARARCHPTLPPRPGTAMRVESEYKRCGAWAYLAALDVHHGKVHGPVHASWLNQIEIYFSIVQRKVLTPNDFPSLAAVEERLLAFQDYYQAIARPFAWTFTRRDLAKLLNKLSSASDPSLRLAA